jgi:hypothetical protein
MITKLFLNQIKKKIYSPLYKINTKELEITKQYLLENLNKVLLKLTKYFLLFLYFLSRSRTRVYSSISTTIN